MLTVIAACWLVTLLTCANCCRLSPLAQKQLQTRLHDASTCTVERHYSKPMKCGHPLFHKADRLFGPTSTWTVQNSLQNADARKPLTQDCPPLLLDAMTGHHNSTGTHSTSLWLAFLASIQQERAMEGRFCSIQHHYTLLSPLKIYWMPFKISTVPHSGHAAVVPIVSALEGLQRTNSLHTTNCHKWTCN